MPVAYAIPRPSEPVLDQNGHFTVPWQNYLRTRYGDAAASEIIAELEAQIADLLSRVEALEEGGSARIVGPQSVSVSGSLAGGLVQLALVGDQFSPGIKFYYGTDENGDKGWFLRELSTLSDVDLTGLADGDLLVWDETAGKWEPGAAVSEQLFNYITTTGEPYCTEDYADLYVGEL